MVDDTEGVSFIDLAASLLKSVSSCLAGVLLFNFKNEERLDCEGFAALDCLRNFCLQSLA